MIKAVGIIPARWGSTRFPGKPLYSIAGKPLLQHVWETARRAKKLETVIIATDDMRIAEAAFEWGADIAMTSPRHRSGTDRVAEVATKADAYSLVINVQGDEPLTDPRLVDQMVRAFERDSSLEMITAAHRFDDANEACSANQVKVVLDANSQALYFSRMRIPFRRDEGAPVEYLRHQGIYGYTRDLLLRFVRWKPSALEQAESLEQLRALENGVRIKVIVTASGSPGVDAPEDVEMIERQLMARRRPTARAKRSDRR